MKSKIHELKNLFNKGVSKKTIIICAIALGAVAFKLADATWTMDKAHSKLGFSITHLMISDVEGSFKTFEVKLTTSKEDFSDAVVEMTSDVSTINTDNEQRDTHLKSADFFDAAKYPKITFKSKSFKKTEDKKYKVTGDLTMHGITKAIELDAIGIIIEHPMSKKTVGGFKISGKIKRSDFGIGSSMGEAILSDEVIINANAEFSKN